MFSKWCVAFCVAIFSGLPLYTESAAIPDPKVYSGDPNWWKHAVFYQIYPRSFKDDNNDGIGDLRGIINKLDHLKDAGITAAWLSPIYKSPQVDQGYDISDFKAIDEEFGTMDDFEELVAKAHSLGIKIVMDFVPNHSSDQHDWFKKSVAGDPDYKDFYVWRDGPSNDQPPNNWLSNFRGSAWTYNDVRKQWYLHAFTAEQPDLNYENSKVLEKMDEVLLFWLDKGVDGFRMDAVPFLCEDQGFKDEQPSGNTNDPDDYDYLSHDYTMDQLGTYALIYHWRELLDKYTNGHGGDERVIMTEAYTNIKNTMKYYGNDTHDGAHFTFNFQLITKLDKNSNARDTVLTIKEWLNYMPIKSTANWVLGNHDKHRVASRFGPERSDGMNMLTALLPGVMVTYNGEEIGQENGEVTWEQGKDPWACNGGQELFDKLSRDFERTPFHWDTSVNAGFNKGAKPWLPVSKKSATNNLSAQKVPGSNSHYHIYQELLKLRQLSAFVSGTLKLVALSDNVLAMSREDTDDLYVVAINVGNKQETIDLSTFGSKIKKNVKVVVANTQSTKPQRILPSNNIELEPYESIVTKAIPDAEQGNLDWWKHAVFYQIYPRSFKDYDNDGIGDLKGITSKLKHLKEAGVTATWLSPIYKSPQIDQGYDISDFTDIDDDYGTLADFDEFVKRAHELGIKVIMDFVPNHSSNKHEWFIKSENREPGYEDFYIWRDPLEGIEPNNWISVFKYSAWKFSEKRKQYYYHAFAEAQPDLNYRNPMLVKKMKEVLTFWMDRGVDGFRMDAVPHLFEDELLRDEPKSGKRVPPYEHAYLKHIYTTDLPETYDMISQWRNLVEDYTKEHGGNARVMMTEAYTDIENTMKYYGNDTHAGAHFTFNFNFITKVNKKSTARDIANTVEEWMDYMPSKYTANWVLGNHDNARVATRFGPQRVDGMNMLAAFLPGVMVTYNGEEIGQENGEVTWEEGQDPNACNGDQSNFEKVSRDFERTPFHWDDSVNAGFNEGRKPWLPVSEKYKTNNLALQKVSSSKSHYRVYQELLKLRQLPSFTKGSLSISAISTHVLAFIREAAHEPGYVVVINIGDKEETVDITSLRGVKKQIRVIATDVNSKKRDSVLSTNSISLSPYESFVARVLPDPDWWKRAIFYQIYPRSFKDDNNDGKGDLKGIMDKLEHLRDMGVTAAWLSPIYKSPQVDQGYDISDFMDIHHEYGTLEIFDEFVEKAHSLDIKVVMDFVPNHSSDQHQWFIDSEKGNDEEYKDYYIWKDGKSGGQPPNNWISLFKGPAWTYSEKRKQWFLHQFAKEQPDLNYRNPNLRQHMKDVLKFWMDRNVDGFRMDAVPYLVEDESFADEPLSNNPNAKPEDYQYLNHIYTENQDGTFDVIYEWRAFIDEYNKNHSNEDPRIFMTEANTNLENVMLYYGNETTDGSHFPFNFFFINDLTKSLTASDLIKVINKWLDNMPEGRVANWVLGNHDVHRVASRYGPERLDGMNMVNALLPGIMVTYQGEEIGQENGEVTWAEGKDPSACKYPEDEGNFDAISRDFERTPYHWDDTVNAGFNEGHECWLPVSKKYKTTNLAAQSVPGINSHYRIYKELIRLREEPAFDSGSLRLSALNQNVAAFVRTPNNGYSYAVVINLGDKQETVDLTTFPSVKTNVKVVVASVGSTKKDSILPSNEITLEAYESIVAKVLPEITMGNQDWWKTAVFYQIYPRSFKDDDNDGIGDLKGIVGKLEHLKDAGVTAAWLSPIYKSPQVDQGYDISDFMDIEGDYGNLNDFDDLLQKARQLGIKIVMDFVPNHSSDLHKWFIKSENRVPGYEDFYVWHDGIDGKRPNNWLSNFKGSAWKWSEKRSQFYLHQFAEGQPDLNYRNPVVVEKMKEVLIFWLNKGVDGFRMDAVPFIFEDEKLRDEPVSGLEVPSNDYKYLNHIFTNDVNETYDMIYQWRTLMDDYVKEHGGDARVMMTEAYTNIENTMKYYGNDTHNGGHFTFNFELITKLNNTSNANDIVKVITTWINHLPSRFVSNWVLGNHDNKRVATRFGPENADGFNMLTALLPGVMITYNGEEIGQEDGEVTWEQGWDPSACNGKEEDFDRVSRDFARTPFHWDSSINAGFNKGTDPWLPVSKKYLETNLALQSDPNTLSHYQIYKQLLELRKEATIVSGDLEIKALTDSVVAFRRTLADNPTYVYLFNVGNEEVTVDVNKAFSNLLSQLQIVLSNTASAKMAGNTLAAEGLVLAPHECVIGITTEPNSAVTAGVSIGILLLMFGILSFF